MYFYIAALLTLLSLLIWWLAGRERKACGLPPGRVIYNDTGVWCAVDQPLYDPHIKLTGRPDYLVRQDEALIPVEIKSAPAPAAPYDSHILQLAAYCLLVEGAYGQRPTHGLLHYNNRTFTVAYTPQLEQALMQQLHIMRRVERRKYVDRSHENKNRCRGCGFSSHCGQRL